MHAAGAPRQHPRRHRLEPLWRRRLPDDAAPRDRRAPSELSRLASSRPTRSSRKCGCSASSDTCSTAGSGYYLKFRAQFVDLLETAQRLGPRRDARVGPADRVRHALGPAARGQGTITVGDFSLFVGGIVQVQSQFTTLLNSVTGIYESLLYMRNLFEFLELPSRNLDAGEEWRGPIESHRVRARQLPLSADRARRAVGGLVHDPQGQALALVGENGAGKTTVVKLRHPTVRAHGRPHPPERHGRRRASARAACSAR